ncbi:mucosa-associated lymphoid tissue lymphoma translocation protein 1-like isoform X2 [Polyodon spathula]|uniref:mucosa-associated lymphoid tissue lymphoma translocation protein 1-like isoform X2 n=1 Tax=Polyodon spathula TaxID=7913 RepID=UPI001B7F7512|nr:mucosa-associated lymphoid tissue lymphoma translocation protein 1-like isoform X2 [Polyodon spathula]
MIRELAITEHPASACVPLNYRVTLRCRAKGSGLLQYQWFQSEDEEVPGATQPDLVITAKKTQVYVCRVNDNHSNCVFSEWVKVKVWQILKTDLPVTWQGQPQIVVHPRSVTIKHNEELKLLSIAFGIPPPRYQWYWNGNLLQDQTKETLLIKKADKEHQGTYLCSVSNVFEEIWTEPAEVNIEPPNKTTAGRFYATDKVALLVGNLNYSNHPNLIAPMMDVQELANLLHALNFRVVSLLNVTKEEMAAAIQEFVKLLDKGVYALFYYAGHGYENSGRNYLVPIDAPQPYRRENCISVQRTMQQMQEKHTALNVVLLDTCRKWYNKDCVPSEVKPLAPLGNTVYGYATSEDAEAYEVQDGSRSSGIFTKYLNKHILLKEKVTHVLEQVSEDLGRDPLIIGKQVMEIKHTLNEPRALTDQICTTGHTVELRERILNWSRANELPERRVLKFPCGTEVELSFSALFSNMIAVFATVKKTGWKTVDCSVSLQSTPVMEDVFSSSDDSTGGMGSLLLSGPDNTDCSLRLSGLQKLKRNLILKVDLHYTSTDSRQRMVESKQEDIGKPLVAKCELHKYAKPLERHEGKATAATFQAPPQRATAYTQLGQPCRPSTRKAENGREHNEPEENDESELLNLAFVSLGQKSTCT